MALALPASVTLDEVPRLLEAVASALAEGDPGPLTIDASAVTELDTAAVALLLHAARLAAARGRTVQLQGVPDKLLALARLYGVESLLPGSALPPSPSQAGDSAGAGSA